MKKTAILLAGILAAGAVYAADAKAAAAPAPVVAPAAVTPAAFTGKIEWKSTAFKVSLGKTEVGSASVDHSTGTAIVIDNDTFGYEPKTTAEFKGKVFDMDARLSIKASEDFGKAQGDRDSTELALSKTVGDTYFEWCSNVQFNQTDLFPALFDDFSIKVKKTMKEVEGQVKASRHTETNAAGVRTKSEAKLSIDTTSSDTYIKWTPGAGALSLTFRPYDMDWTYGDEFKNENFDKMEYGSSAGNGVINFKHFDTFSVDPIIAKSSINQVGGLEIESKIGEIGKVFVGVSSAITNSTDVKVKDGDEVIDSNGNICFKAGVDLKPNADTKLVAVLLGNGGSSKKELKPKVGSSTTNEDGGTYFAVNVDGETKVSSLKIEGEFDLRNYGYEDKTKDATGEIKHGAFKLGLMGKATIDAGVAAPYGKLKIETIAIGFDKGAGAGASYSSWTAEEDSQSKVGIYLGVDKKVEALTLNAEFGLDITNSSIKTTAAKGASTVETKIGDTSLGLGVKATYEF